MPWAANVNVLGLAGFRAVMGFPGVLAIGLAYEW